MSWNFRDFIFIGAHPSITCTFVKGGIKDSNLEITWFMQDPL